MSEQRQQGRQISGGVAGFGRPMEDHFSPFRDRLEPFRSAPRFGDRIRIADRTYREIDYGNANVLVPIHDPQAAAELAKRREGLERVQHMAQNPIGGAAYGLATAAGASPRDRDRALAVGASVDAVLSQATPRGTFGFSRAAAPRKALDDPDLPRQPARFGKLTPTEQATYAGASITQSMLGRGTRASRRLTPPGWLGHGRKNNQGRGHLLAKELGGTGRDMRNIVTITQSPTNSSHMRRFERGVADRVRDGEVVEYFVRPFYDGSRSAPSAILMMEQGSRGGASAKIIQNPSGYRK